MFNIEIKDKIVEHCVDVLKTQNFGQRSHSNGTYEQQLRGIIAEAVVQDLCGFDWVDGKGGCDGCVDLIIGEYTCDVKTMKRTVYPNKLHHVGNFPACQFNYGTDILIFTSINQTANVLTICGWIPKDEFRKKSRLYKENEPRPRTDGTEYTTPYDQYEVGYKYLRKTLNASHLMNQIYMGWNPIKA